MGKSFSNFIRTVVALGELRSGGIVDDESHVGMELKSGSGDSGGDWPFDGFGDGCGLGRAGGEQENSASFQDRADPHSDGATRALLARSEKFGIIVQCFAAQNFQAGAGADAGSRLVESDVTITSNAQ